MPVKTVEDATTELELWLKLLAAIRSGYAEKGIEAYRNFKGDIRTTETFVLLLQAVTNSASSPNLVNEIVERSAECVDYADSHLNMKRQLAIYAAIVDRSAEKAWQFIREVKESRPTSHAEGIADELAYRITQLFDSNKWAAFDGLLQLYRNTDSYNRTEQSRLDVEWWAFVAAVATRKNDRAREIAQFSLQTRRESDPNRIDVYQLAAKRIGGGNKARAALLIKYGRL